MQQQKSSLSDEVMLWCQRGVRAGRSRTVGKCAEENRNEAFQIKDLVHLPKWIINWECGERKMLQTQLPETKKFKYLGSTLRIDGEVGTKVNRRIQYGWSN